MDNLEYIEAYFNEEFSSEQKKEFEQRIITDLQFAEELSFYISTRQVAAEIKDERERFREVYEHYKQSPQVSGSQPPTLFRKLLPWAAVAAVLAGVVFSWNIWFKSISPQELADKYVTENFKDLPVLMGDNKDSLQTGLNLYNAGRLEEALKQFESIVLSDTSFFEAKKYAGIVSLRLREYDKAINYFSEVENTKLHANPGKFYHALTLMKRNQPQDKQEAKRLLQQVVENGLAENETAERWLKKW